MAQLIAAWNRPYPNAMPSRVRCPLRVIMATAAVVALGIALPASCASGFELLWKVPCAWRFPRTPAVDSGRVAIMLEHGKLSILDLVDGSELAVIQPVTMHETPTVWGDLMYVPSSTAACALSV